MDAANGIAGEDATVADLLERMAQRRPESVFAVFSGGEAWTFARAALEAWATAARLRSLGVEPGDRVISWLPNGKAGLRALLGILALGAVYVPLNTGYRGSLLAHAVEVSGAGVVLTHGRLVERLAGAGVPGLRTVVVASGAAEVGDRIEGAFDVHGPEALEGPAESRPEVAIAPWDPMAVIFTSGTTGPSKGALHSYRFYRATCETMYAGLGAGDRFYGHLPLYHVGGLSSIYGMLRLGGSIFLTDRFDSHAYWEVVRRHGLTSACLIGAMATFLWKQPRRPDDADTPMRRIVMSPLIGEVGAFRERFATEVVTQYGSTESGTPVRSGPEHDDPRSCGRLVDGYEARLVDDHDEQVAPGEAGELVLRHAEPWVMMSGYVGMPEATARAWRNGWLHTGDVFRRDASGRYFFVDRAKDCIRRRGENISSVEVEQEILTAPDVVEAAVVGVDVDEVEQEVLAAVVPRDAATFDPVALTEHLVERLPHFMVPRFVAVVPRLPRTATDRVQKHVLRDDAQLLTSAWDREAHGLRLRRERLSP